MYRIEPLIETTKCIHFHRCGGMAVVKVSLAAYMDDPDAQSLCRRCYGEIHNRVNKGKRRNTSRGFPQLNHVGRDVGRCRNGLLERIIAERWIRANELHKCRGVNSGHGILQDLFVKQEFGKHYADLEINQREAYIVSTVIQWLGSPVGSDFMVNCLRLAGYKIDERDVLPNDYYHCFDEEWARINNLPAKEQKYAMKQRRMLWPPRVAVWIKRSAIELWKAYKKGERSPYSSSAKKPTAEDLGISTHPMHPDFWQAFARAKFDGRIL